MPKPLKVIQIGYNDFRDIKLVKTMLKACYEVQVQVMCIIGLQPIQITLGFLLKTCQN